MFEKPDLQVILFSSEDVIRTSGEFDWQDENVDENGWT